MIITHGDTRQEKQQLKYLCDLFKKLFENKVGDVLETRIHGKLSLLYHYADQDYLEYFVKEYFVMRALIVDNHNAMIEYIQSEDFNKETIITKFLIKKELNYWQKLCENINIFEKEFFERTKISLLRVENERWAKEQTEKKEQAIEQ